MIAMALSTVILNSSIDAASVSRKIDAAFYNAETGYYREESTTKDKAFNWTLGVVLSSQNAMAKLDKANIPKLVSTLEKADTYWNPKGPVAGFDVLPGSPPPNDRYYDDNAWMVMSLVESYEITKDSRWLDRAKQALTFVLSGEDAKLGGGIYWREKEKASKNTCSNGPSAAACMAVYAVDAKPELLEKAKSIYQWTKKNLQDPADGLYWDNLSLGGKVEKTKWTYNSALMLRSAKALFAVTKDAAYKSDADLLEKACVARWVKADGSIDDEMPFAHLLFENLDPHSFDAALCINRLKAFANSDGVFPHRWSAEGKPSSKLLVQASALRAIAMTELRKK